MKKKFTLLMMSLLLIAGGVQAKTVRKYLRLADVTTNVDATLNVPENSVSLKWNARISWTLANKDLSGYENLVVNLTSAPTNSIFVYLNDGGEFYPLNKLCNTVLAEDETTLTINLASLTHTGLGTDDDKGDGSDIDLTNVTAIGLFNQQVGDPIYKKADFTIESIYLEKTVEDASYNDYTTEPFDFTNLTYMQDGSTTFDASTYTFSFTGGSYGGWQWDTPQDWSDYKYLVVIPQHQWNTGNIHCSYVLEDNASHVIDDAIMRWGEWNMARAAVLDLTTVKTTVFESGSDATMEFDIKNITKFYFRPIWGASGDFGVAAVYLTNTAPVFGDNHNNASSIAIYKREYTEKDKWGTVCLPYNAAVCGAEVYEVVGVDKLDAPSELYLQEVKYMMEAGKSYVFKNTQDDANSFHLANVTFYQVGEYETVTPTGDNLKGTFAGAAVPNDGTSYILKGGEWKCVNGTTNTVGAYRAYLTLTESLVVPKTQARDYIIMNLDGDGGATGISLQEITKDGENTGMKDGKYFENGKIVIVKNGVKYSTNGQIMK